MLCRRGLCLTCVPFFNPHRLAPAHAWHTFVRVTPHLRALIAGGREHQASKNTFKACGRTTWPRTPVTAHTTYMLAAFEARIDGVSDPGWT